MWQDLKISAITSVYVPLPVVFPRAETRMGVVEIAIDPRKIQTQNRPDLYTCVKYSTFRVLRNRDNNVMYRVYFLYYHIIGSPTLRMDLDMSNRSSGCIEDTSLHCWTTHITLV